MKLKSLTVQVSVMLTLAVTTTLVLFVIAWLFITESSLKAELDQSLTLISNRLANSIRLPLYNYDQEAVKDVILSEMRDKNISAVFVSESDDAPPLMAFQRTPEDEIRQVHRYVTVPNSLNNKVGIQYKNQMLGTLSVFVTTSYMERKLNNLILSSIAQIIILDIILITLCVLLLKFKFINPIVNLTDVSSRIAQGHLDQTIEFFGENEIGILATSLETMRNAIKDKITSLGKLNTELQKEIDERKQFEIQLNDSRENLRITLDSLLESVITTDLTGKVTRLNPVAETLTGWKSDAAQGKPLDSILKIIDKSTRKEISIEEKYKLDTSHKADYILIDKNNQEKDIAASGAPIHNAQGEKVGMVIVLQDITDKLRLEEQVRHAQKMDSIGQLAGGVAHDFNNMLVGIAGSADMLSLKLKNDDKNMKFVDIIREAAEKAADLTQKLLDFSRKGKMLTKEVDCHELIQGALDMLKRSIDKRIQLVEKFEAKDTIIKGDPTQLQNVFLNLGINARDAMPHGGVLTYATENVTISKERSIEMDQSLAPGSYVQVHVTDSGHGIPPEIINRIFEPFFTTKEVGEGTGLGLASVYGAIKEHRGSIDVASVPNKGSCFSLLLPVIHTTIQAKQPPPPKASLTGTGTVLLVDDEKIVQQTGAALLKELGYNVIVAQDGEQAISLYKEKQNSIDVVLLDLVMPKKSGFDTFNELRAINPSVRVLLSSGFTKNRLVEEVIDQGAVGFLSKPYRSVELAQKISMAFEMSLSKS